MLIKHQYINTACVFYLSNRLDGDGIMKTNGLTVCQGNFETIYISKSTYSNVFKFLYLQVGFADILPVTAVFVLHVAV